MVRRRAWRPWARNPGVTVLYAAVRTPRQEARPSSETTTCHSASPACSTRSSSTSWPTSQMETMLRIPAGSFSMGSTEFYGDESPVCVRNVGEFDLDRAPVTNDQFAAFVDATGYVTVAERTLDPLDFPGVDPQGLLPGAMVFRSTPAGRSDRLVSMVDVGSGSIVAPSRGPVVGDQRPGSTPRRASRVRGRLPVCGLGRKASAHRDGMRVRLPGRTRRCTVRLGR